MLTPVFQFGAGYWRRRRVEPGQFPADSLIPGIVRIGWKRVAVALLFGVAAASWSCSRETPSEPTVERSDLLQAMMAIRAHGDARLSAIAAKLPSIDEAIDLVKRDRSAGGSSRRRRALASLLARSWDAEPPSDLGERLGASRLDRVKAAIVDRYSAEVVALFDDDRSWREYIVLRTLIDDPTVLAAVDARPTGWFASLAYADPTPSGNACWRPEAPSTVTYLDPALTIQTYVSINGDVGTGGRTFEEVKANLDPQRWDECSTFWSPPPDGTYLAVIAEPTPPGCALSPGNIIPASPNPSASPGAPFYTGKLFERFHCATVGCQAWFENLLDVSVIPHTVPYPGGTPLPSHLINYRLPNCANGEQSGFLAGEIIGKPTRVILDEGWMEAWQQDGRTHVKTFKKVQFGGPLNTWVAASILGMTELSNTMGELACCEP